MILTPSQEELLYFKHEAMARNKIPFSRLVDPETIETKSGHLLQVIKVKGLISETLDDVTIDYEKQLRNSLFRSIADSSLSIYFHTIREKYTANLEGKYYHEFAAQLQKQWQKALNKKQLYINEHYITLVKKPPQGKIRGIAYFLQSLSSSFNKKAREIYRLDALKELNSASNKVLSTFKHYDVKKLTDVIDKNHNFTYSELLSFLAKLINADSCKLVPPSSDLASFLPFKRLFFDRLSGNIALRSSTGRVQYAGILSIKEYHSETVAGMLDHLSKINAEFIITQSFTFMDRNIARNKILEQQRNFAQSDDSNEISDDSISDALDQLGSSAASIGSHHLTIFCKADSIDQLVKDLTKVDTALNEIGIISIREDIGVKAAFFASLPGNHAYIARPASITTQNMASFASLHNHDMGKAKENFWGDSITILETAAGTPFHFNFHELDIGNTFLIGPMGSGKTLVEMFLLILSLKLGGRLIVLDKDRGCEIAIRALGGDYSVMAAGHRTGFAPFQVGGSENRDFLITLMNRIACTNDQTLNDEDKVRINNCVDGALNLPIEKRILRNIVPFLGMLKPGSLRARFENWVNNGQYAWVFDNDVDTLSLNNDIFGRDMTCILEDKFVSGVIYYYLFNRIEKLMDGSRTRIVVAEGWKPLQDDIFRSQIQDWSSTIRKKNTILVLDTQSPSDIAQSPIGSKIIQETVTQIYFANPKAEYEDYVNKFKLSTKEWQIIKHLEKDKRFFLIKQGKKSAVARIDLTGMEDHITILSARTHTVAMLDEIRRRVGDSPKNWMPIFLKEAQNSEDIRV